MKGRGSVGRGSTVGGLNTYVPCLGAAAAPSQGLIMFPMSQLPLQLFMASGI